MTHIANSPSHLEDLNKAAKANSDKFWNDFAKENFTWRKPWDQVQNCNMQKADIKWFEGAEMNITENCIDRHLESKGDQTAILFEANDVNEKSLAITYKQLSKNVNKTANMLKAVGIKKGIEFVCTCP